MVRPGAHLGHDTITETGFVRVSANPHAIPLAVSPPAAIHQLRALCARGDHDFWPDSVRLLDEPPGLAMNSLVGYRQVTDGQLLAVATGRGGHLVTVDIGMHSLADPARQGLVVRLRVS